MYDAQPNKAFTKQLRVFEVCYPKYVHVSVCVLLNVYRSLSLRTTTVSLSSTDRQCVKLRGKRRGDEKRARQSCLVRGVPPLPTKHRCVGVVACIITCCKSQALQKSCSILSIWQWKLILSYDGPRA